MKIPLPILVIYLGLHLGGSWAAEPPASDQELVNIMAKQGITISLGPTLVELKAYLEKKPESREGQQFLFHLLRGAQRLDEAKEQAAYLVEHFPDHRESWESVYRISFYMNDPKEELKALKMLEKLTGSYGYTPRRRELEGNPEFDPERMKTVKPTALRLTTILSEYWKRKKFKEGWKLIKADKEIMRFHSEDFLLPYAALMAEDYASCLRLMGVSIATDEAGRTYLTCKDDPQRIGINRAMIAIVAANLQLRSQGKPLDLVEDIASRNNGPELELIRQGKTSSNLQQSMEGSLEHYMGEVNLDGGVMQVIQKWEPGSKLSDDDLLTPLRNAAAKAKIALRWH